MKKALINHAPRWSALLCLWLVLPTQRAMAQFVELTAEVEINDWSYWFLEDEKSLPAENGHSAQSIFTRGAAVRCVVGPNTWMMEGEFARNAKVTRWFT